MDSEGVIKLVNSKLFSFQKHAYTSVGIHPWYIDDHSTEEALKIIEQRAKDKEIQAIGECGIDKISTSELVVQKEIFITQAKIAEHYKLNMIIHCVKGYSELLEIRKKGAFTVPWILHGYNGGSLLSQQLAKAGMYFSLGKALQSPNSKLSKAIDVIPLNRIFFETDDLDIPVSTVYERYAKLRNIDMPDLQEQILCNFARIFKT